MQNAFVRFLRFLVFCMVFTFAAPGVQANPMLTDLLVFGADASGNFTTQTWNTHGNDPTYNVYIAPGPSLLNPMLNGPGNGVDVEVNEPLNYGTYQYALFGDQFLAPSYFNMNLYFNGNTNAAGISVYAAVDTSSVGPDPVFAANSGTGPWSPHNNGVGTLVFNDGLFSVELTQFRWASPNAEGLDRVQSFSGLPGGGADYVGQFTLVVSPVPEPSSLVLLLIGTLLLASRRRCPAQAARV